MVVSAQDHCNAVLDHVRSSNLNFLSQETSYSVYLTIRKSFVKNYPSNHSPYHGQTYSSFLETKDASEAELNCLKMKLSKLENENAILTKAYEEEIDDSRELMQNHGQAQKAIENLQNNFNKVGADLENLKNAKIQLEKKHEQTCCDLKVLKTENANQVCAN